MKRSKVFPRGIRYPGYYLSLAMDAPSVGLTAYNICYMERNGEGHLVLQVVAETLCMMQVCR